MLSIGVSIVIFLLVAVVVMLLFYLVTKIRYHKLKTLYQNNQHFCLEEEISKGDEDDQNQGEYEIYIQNLEKNEKVLKQNVPIPATIQMTSYYRPLIGSDTERDTTSSKLFNKLFTDFHQQLSPQPIKAYPQSSHRHPPSTRSFPPSSRASTRSHHKAKAKGELFVYQYVGKIVCHSEQGVEIIQNVLQSIEKKKCVKPKYQNKQTLEVQQMKQRQQYQNSSEQCEKDYKIVQKKFQKVQQVKKKSSIYQDIIQSYNLKQKQIPSCLKFVQTLQIPHLYPNQQFPVSALKSTCTQHVISIDEYMEIKREFLENQ